MAIVTSQEQRLATSTRVHRVAGKPDDPYEIIFVNHTGLPIVPLTEWYRLRKPLGPRGTRNTYLTYLSYLEEQACPWNAPPDQCLYEPSLLRSACYTQARTNRVPPNVLQP